VVTSAVVCVSTVVVVCFNFIMQGRQETAAGRGRGGRGRGRGRGGRGNERDLVVTPSPPSMAGGRGGISASTVDEEMRIRFTSQLHQLRESQVTEVQFPSTLNNVVRTPMSHLTSFLPLRPFLGKEIPS
jgi:hypothetical protein